jgi:hypothetical protein
MRHERSQRTDSDLRQGIKNKLPRCHWKESFNRKSSTRPLHQLSISSFLVMCLMHLHLPVNSASILRYPNLIGSYKISHKVLRNPNSPYASLRSTNHSYSTRCIFGFPNSVHNGQGWIHESYHLDNPCPCDPFHDKCSKCNLCSF